MVCHGIAGLAESLKDASLGIPLDSGHFLAESRYAFNCLFGIRSDCIDLRLQRAVLHLVESLKRSQPLIDMSPDGLLGSGDLRREPLLGGLDLFP